MLRGITEKKKNCVITVSSVEERKNTLEFLCAWEQIYNNNFKVVEFDYFRQQAGLHIFVLSASEWREKQIQ